MKANHPWRIAVFGALLLSPATGTTPSGASRQIQTRVVWYEVDTASCRKILSTPRNSADDSDLLKMVEDWVALDKARIVDTMVATCQTGGESKSDGVIEVIFPESFRPPTLPGNGQSGPATPPQPIPSTSQSAISGLSIDAAEISGETGSISVRLTTATSRLSGEKTWFEWKTPQGNADVKMPIFTDLSCELSLTVIPGVPVMAAALTPIGANHKPDRNRKLLIFVTATIEKPTMK